MKEKRPWRLDEKLAVALSGLMMALLIAYFATEDKAYIVVGTVLWCAEMPLVSICLFRNIREDIRNKRSGK